LIALVICSAEAVVGEVLEVEQLWLGLDSRHSKPHRFDADISCACSEQVAVAKLDIGKTLSIHTSVDARFDVESELGVSQHGGLDTFVATDQTWALPIDPFCFQILLDNTDLRLVTRTNISPDNPPSFGFNSPVDSIPAT
jgi:hypothetical protein